MKRKKNSVDGVLLGTAAQSAQMFIFFAANGTFCHLPPSNASMGVFLHKLCRPGITCTVWLFQGVGCEVHIDWRIIVTFSGTAHTWYFFRFVDPCIIGPKRRSRAAWCQAHFFSTSSTAQLPFCHPRNSTTAVTAVSAYGTFQHFCLGGSRIFIFRRGGLSGALLWRRAT